MIPSIKIHIGTIMIKKIFDNERQYLNFFFDKVDIQKMEELLEILKECKGALVLSGVGKSGLIAKKIAATMTSTNTRALFLSPVNALHGDIGIVSPEDIFIFLSKTGESDELLTLIPSLRNKKVKLIAVVSNVNSRLAKACDIVVHLPLEKEICPFDIAPTTSTTIQMIFGDVMAIALMQARNFTIDEFAINHPAGRIGKRIILKVRDLMIRGKEIPFCKKEDLLLDTLVELSNKKCGCVLIVDQENRLEGIFTDGDLRRALQKHGPEALHSSMETVMVKSPRTTKPEALVVEALKIMEGTNSEVTALPVIDENKGVVGIIKLHDIIQSGI